MNPSNTTLKDVIHPLLSSLLLTMTGGLASWGGMVFLPLYAPLNSAILNHVDKYSLLQGLLWSLLLLVLSWIFFSIVYKKLKGQLAKQLTQTYRFNAKGGYYTDPENDAPLCPSCLSSGKIIHMTQTASEILKCPTCGANAIPPETQIKSFSGIPLRKSPYTSNRWQAYCHQCGSPAQQGRTHNSPAVFCSNHKACNWCILLNKEDYNTLSELLNP